MRCQELISGNIFAVLSSWPSSAQFCYSLSIARLRLLLLVERQRECGLTTLETRRLRGDQIDVIKIFTGYENIDGNMFFSLKKNNRTRGHEVILVKGNFGLDIRKYSFSRRTINEWNALYTDCVTASSVTVFEYRLTHISGGRATNRLKSLDSR